MLILFLVKRGLTLTEACHRLNKNKARFWESANNKLCQHIYRLDKEQRAMRTYGNYMGQKDLQESLVNEVSDHIDFYTIVRATVETFIGKGENYQTYSDSPDYAYNYGPPPNVWNKDYYQVR